MRNPLGAVLLSLSLVGCGAQGEVGNGLLEPDAGVTFGVGSGGNGAGQTGGGSVVQSSAGTPGGGTGGAIGDQTSCTTGVVPADVATVLASRCLACHGNPPLVGVPASLSSYAGLTAPSKTDPSKTNVQLAVLRVQDNTRPMPPAPASRLAGAEIAVLSSWVSAGSPPVPCADGGANGPGNSSDGGTGAETGASVVTNPYNTAPVCTSKTTWSGGNRGSNQMNPGLACINCHSKGRGPRYAIAGTLFPTAHEPDLCDGANGNNGAQIVIVGADKKSITLTPNAAGNFYYQGMIATPYQAKVVYMGRERVMAEAQTSGDCNTCHTQAGAMKAPGRVMLP